MITIITVTVTTPDGTEGVADAIAYALDSPLNYPDDADTQDWGVDVSDGTGPRAELTPADVDTLVITAAELWDPDGDGAYEALSERQREVLAKARRICDGEHAGCDGEDKDYDTSSLAKEDARNAWQHRSPDGYPGDDTPPPWLGDPDRNDGEIEFAVEDEEN